MLFVFVFGRESGVGPGRGVLWENVQEATFLFLPLIYNWWGGFFCAAHPGI